MIKSREGKDFPSTSDQLKRAIKHRLMHLGAGAEMNSALLQSNNADPDTIIQSLKEKGVINHLVKQIGPSRSLIAQELDSEPASISKDSGRLLLHINILGGRAFTEYVSRQAFPNEMLVLHGELFGQRFSSKPAMATAEPGFTGEAFVELPGGDWTPDGTPPAAAGGKPEALRLLSIRQPLRLSVTQQTELDAGSLTSAGLTQRLTTAAVGAAEWRTVLVRGGDRTSSRRAVTISVQLGNGPSSEPGRTLDNWNRRLPATLNCLDEACFPPNHSSLASGLPSAPAGVIMLQLALVSPSPIAPLEEPLLTSQQRMEAARDSQLTSNFLSRARSWWAEFIAIRSDFRSRPVKVMARCEDGHLWPSPTFLAPLQLGRQLPTPRHAARFVSLLRRREDEEEAGIGVLGGGGLTDGVSGCWSLPHTVLSSRSASRDEAALLLCGLLLGFGLDAWVAVGRLRGGAGHTWVMTRGAMAMPCFWEPATGVRYTVDDAGSWPYLSVGCVFNHQRICANCQQDGDELPMTTFLLEDAAQWRTLEVPRAQVPGPCWVPPELCPSTPDPDQGFETLLEANLMSQISQRRRDTTDGSASRRQQPAGVDVGGGPSLPLGTQWDLALSHLLMPALEAYEQEAITGEVAPGNAEFQQGIRRAVPLGWIFKGFPLHQHHLCPKQTLQSLIDEPQVLDILATTNPEARFALRVRVTPYPEGLFSCWVMLAVKHPQRDEA